MINRYVAQTYDIVKCYDFAKISDSRKEQLHQIQHTFIHVHADLYFLSEDMDCCGESQYNTTTHICCENKAFKKMKGIICCLSEAYDPTTHHCVDDKVLLLTQGICSNVTYNTSSMRCCDNRVLHNISVYTNPVDCCGTQVYSINTQQCCHGTNIRAPKNEKCCGQGNPTIDIFL